MDGIVVGVDGSSEGLDALRWAVEEGRAGGGAVTAVLAWEELDQHQADGSRRFTSGYGPAEAEAALAAIVAQAVGADSGVVEVARRGQPAGTLLDAARRADLLVVGARRAGDHPVVGSVSQQCLHHTPCPLVIVAGPAPGTGRTVVGVDGSPESLAALGWAAAHARRRGGSVEAVHATRSEGSPDDEVLRRALERLGPDAVASIDPVVVEGAPAAALLERAEGADAVVVGTRGSGGFHGLLVGSVAHRVAYGAPGPVVLVPT